MHRLRTRYGKEDAIKKYWSEEAGPTELLVLMFLYFSAYLTGVGALLDRLNPPDKTVPLITDDLNATTFTLATNASIETTDVSVDDFDNGWWWILLVFYWILLIFHAFLPVAGCAFVGIVMPNAGTVRKTLEPGDDEPDGPSDAPDDPIKYAEWLEKNSNGGIDGFLLSIIAPFEKKYSWCVTVLVMTRDT